MESFGKSLRQLMRSGQVVKMDRRNILRGILTGLHHLSTLGIIHRDIKPSNILVDPQTSHAKICDFGCAILVAPTADRKDAPVICALTYRAPELLFASPYYSSSNAVDVWSAGCIFAELLTERYILFPAVQETDLFFRLMLLLGTPTLEDVRDMRLGGAEKIMQTIAVHHHLPPLRLADTLFSGMNNFTCDDFCDVGAVQLLEKMLVYSPRKRIAASQALGDSWFADREPFNSNPSI